MVRSMQEWRELLREAGRDPATESGELQNLWALATVEEPHNEALLNRIRSQGQTAAKRDKRLQRERGHQAASSDAPVASSVSSAPAVVPASVTAPSVTAPSVTAPSVAVSAGVGSSGAYDPAEEEHDFVRDVTRAVLGRSGGVVELTREQALAALAVWRTHVTGVDGRPWHYVRSPGMAAVSLGNWLCARYPSMIAPEPLHEDSPVWEIASSGGVMRVLSWMIPERAPQLGQTVAEYDVTAQFLAAMRSARLGDGEPVVLDRDALAGWDLADLVKRPGWVELADVPDLSGVAGHVAAAFARAGEGTVLPAPLAEYLVRDHGVEVELARAVVWGRRTRNDGTTVNAYGQRLSRMAEMIAANRERLMALGTASAEHALALLKEIYSRFSSGFLRSETHNSGRWLRPDWADMIVGHASANSLRALDKAAAGGWLPCGQSVDSALFALDVEVDEVPTTTPVGLVVSTQPGKWHLNRWGAASETLVGEFTRRRPRMGEAMREIDDARRATQ